MSKKCAAGFFCFEERIIYFLVVAFVIVGAFSIRHYQRLTRLASSSIQYIKRSAIPINVPSRGPAPEYERIGTLHENNSPVEKRGKVLPLFGRQTYPRSSKWMYYTMTDTHNMVQLPIQNKRQRNCMDTLGCEEMYSDDTIHVDAYSGDFTVQLYKPQTPRYIPVV